MLRFLCLVALTSYFSCVEHTLAGTQTLDIIDLSQCPYQVEPIGCFADRQNSPGERHRLLPDQVVNSRDEASDVFVEPSLDWDNYNHWLANFICMCAGIVLEHKNIDEDYIGIQNFGECWNNLNNKHITNKTYGKHGSSSNCTDSAFQEIGDEDDLQRCGGYSGASHTNFIYKISTYSSEGICPLYFEDRGCWNDLDGTRNATDRPLTHYLFTDREPSDRHFSDTLVDWKNWGNPYLPSSLCRCATAAKEIGMSYFGIQFYGQCWAGNTTKFNSEGEISECMDSKFKRCDYEEKMCRPNPCVGMLSVNKVYQIKQGPLACLADPCENGASCIPDGMTDYECKCTSGFTGKDCEVITPLNNY